MKKQVLSVMVSALIFSAGTIAKEYPVGGPVIKEGMEIASSYLLDISMEPHIVSMAMGSDTIHLETDVHATQDNKWGFPAEAWIPYLHIDYVLTKKGDKDFFEFGHLLAMTAADGPHYAQSIKIKGPGTYTVKFKYSAPDETGFMHHTDQETGVPGWFSPFVETFTFQYPQK